MLSALQTGSEEVFLAANLPPVENSRLGVQRKNLALHLGQEVLNSTTALGLRGWAALTRVRSRDTAKERDTESGNDYFGARYYNSAMGRFMSPDPGWGFAARLTNPQSLNMYSYALNNPLKFTDPTGMYCYYGDTGGGAQNAKDLQDGSQFDYHSSQGECETADENGNKGQWINDGATHLDAQNGWVDDAGREDNYVMPGTTNYGSGMSIRMDGNGQLYSSSFGQNVTLDTSVPTLPPIQPVPPAEHYLLGPMQRPKLTNSQIFYWCGLASLLQNGGNVPGGYGVADPSEDPLELNNPVPGRARFQEVEIPGQESNLAAARMNEGAGAAASPAGIAAVFGTAGSCVQAVSAANR